MSMSERSAAIGHADRALSAVREIARLVGKWDLADECGLPYERRSDAEDAIDLVAEVGAQTALVVEALRRDLRDAHTADLARLQKVAEQGQQETLMDAP